MYLSKAEIQGLGKLKRLNLINSITGIKPANLIGTRSKAGMSNLAIFSSIVHLGSNPALLGFISRPSGEVPRHTWENILETGYYTINHIHQSFIERAHNTSAKFGKAVSEFDTCDFTEEYIDDFYAPFVKESQLKIGMKFLEKIPIKINGTILVIGTIECLTVPDAVIDEQGHIDLGDLNNVGISGLNSYYRLEKITSFPYARPEALPEFK